MALQNNPITIKQQVEQFLTMLSTSEARPQTGLAYGTDLKRWMAFLNQHVGREALLSDWEPGLVTLFLESEIQSGKHVATLRRRLAAIRRFSTFLQSQGTTTPIIQVSAAFFQKLPNKAPSSSTIFLEQAHVKMLKKALLAMRKPLALRDWAIFTLTMESTFTVATLVQIQLNDIDWEHSRIRFPGASHKYLSLTASFNPLKQYVEQGRPELSRNISEMALFISQSGRQLTRQGIWQIFKHWGQRAKLPFNLTPRLVQQTAILRLIQQGHSVDEIKLYLNHNNTFSTYATLRRIKARAGAMDVTYPLEGVQPHE